MAKKCWCGKCKTSGNGNGPVKHWVMNWALYWPRKDDLEKAHNGDTQ